MRCKQSKNRLSAYMDNLLSAQEKERLERHLAQCPHCRRELANLQETVHLLQTAPETPAPDHFLKQVNAALETREQQPSLGKTIGRYLFVPFRIKIPVQLAAATVMAAVVIMVVTSPEMEKVSETVMQKHGRTDTVVESPAWQENRDTSFVPETAKRDTRKKSAAKSWAETQKFAAVPAQPSSTREIQNEMRTPSRAAGKKEAVEEDLSNRPAESAPAKPPQITAERRATATGPSPGPLTITLTLDPQPHSFGSTGSRGKTSRSQAALEEPEGGCQIYRLRETAPQPEASAGGDQPEKRRAAEIKGENLFPEPVKNRLGEPVRAVNGKILTFTPAAGELPAYLTVSIPARKYPDFIRHLTRTGQVDAPSISAPDAGKRLTLIIRLIEWQSTPRKK